ncbi:hypothetical protein N7478_000720 [Penicillium angulare]|uniref:uncharacterized protein n=1 Tax=Penicillium angulare TaxID=116970 RepID=UPI0025410018|nr:uncharacterized protein N7478_000720 [Penicillium angulare]KAJ5291469.1 hypothetical protein N7478_000720 [Penicillium angulare]
MAKISHRRQRRGDANSETVSLLSPSFSVQARPKKRNTCPATRVFERPSVENIHASPSERLTRLTLRLRCDKRKRAEDTHNSPWRASSLYKEHQEAHGDKSAVKERIRQEWLKRLRPRPNRRDYCDIQ